MTWTLLIGLALGLAIALVALAVRRAEMARMDAARSERRDAIDRGSHRARLQYPEIDLTRCIGCGTCVAACPEEGVLELVHGQALVVHGARCVGHGRCARECPTGAIAVTLGDLTERRDIPALDDSFAAPGVPGLFLAGEVTGYALIRTAIAHGTAVAGEVARRVEHIGRTGGDVLDLVIVGAGPAGLACSLEARRRGLRFATIDQAELGGTVSSYPRRKLVMTQPVELPLHGRLSRTSYEKEELVDLWEGLAERHELPVRTGIRFTGLARRADDTIEVQTDQESLVAANVCLALGRRGTPRKLDVPGEELSKVAYGLLDAQSYTDCDILVVGGGDSAVEAALGLAEVSTNRVTLSYRRHAFFRLKARNEARLQEVLAAGRLSVAFQSRVVRIEPDAVELAVADGQDAPERPLRIANDHVFVLAGGIPPFGLLEEAGVSFDPADRPAPTPLVERGTGLVRALAIALGLAVATIGWALWHRGYYGLPVAERTGSPVHELLRPSGTLGLPLGMAAALLIAANLCYLARRNPRIPFELGSLQGWMTAHVATGVLAFLLALLHAGMAPLDTVGGHSFWALAVLVATGAIGRYFYSYVPRAANGRELAIEEIERGLARLAGDWDQEHRAFGEAVRSEVAELVRSGPWKGSFLHRLGALIRSRRDQRRTLRRLRADAEHQGLPADQVRALGTLAARAQRAALLASHYEDVRGLLDSWRWLHRWFALLMVLLVLFHVAIALRFGELFG